MIPISILHAQVSASSYHSIAGGWRYTNQGWEHVDSWRLENHETVQQVPFSQPAPADEVFHVVDALGRIHPMRIALSQSLLCLGIMILPINVRQQKKNRQANHKDFL